MKKALAGQSIALAPVPRKYRDICSEMRQILSVCPLLPEGPIDHAVYVLFDPRYARMKYIGFTKNFAVRYNAHLSQLLARTHKTNWLRGLLAEGYLPIMVQVSPELSGEEARRSEISLIRSFREIMWPLTNQTDGGTGAPGYQWTEGARRNLSSALRKEKIPLTPRERPLTKHTDESVGKIIAANAGESNHQAKLTVEQVAEMRRLMDSGVPNIDVARQFNVSETQTSRIRRNSSWKR